MDDKQEKSLMAVETIAAEQEMKDSYLEYSMSVIASRALPDVRDGLKPVHRRILYSMAESGFDANKPYKKSARIVGDVIAKYHPHGNEAVYETMVRMAQDFSMGIPLVDGHGNFGSMDGDKAAAMRYTEARLSKAAHFVLKDYDKSTVEMTTNYDESLLEPKVLPTRIVNLLVNGTSGIAVGMATNIPPHNLKEVTEACCAMIDDPAISLEDLVSLVPGPDFPTGGIIMESRNIKTAYETGRGSILVRGKAHFEEVRKDKMAIIITEIPFQVNKAKMLERIADLTNQKVLEGISDIRDESNLQGVRVVIELKRGVTPDVVLNRVYAMTPLQTSFGFNMLALLDGKPMQLGLKEILQAFIEFRYEVIVKRTQHFLSQASSKAHVFLGLLVALHSIDDVIRTIKSSKNTEEAHGALKRTPWPISSNILSYVHLLQEAQESPEGDAGSQDYYHLSDEQVKGILALRLHRLTSLEQNKIFEDLNKLAQDIAYYMKLLGSKEEIFKLMKEELQEVARNFGQERKTAIEQRSGGLLPHEDLIEKEDMVVTISVRGYIKRENLDRYKSQKRGGKGKNAMKTYEEDGVGEVFMADTHTTLLFFSTLGRAYALKVYELPCESSQSKGKPLVGLLPLEQEERVATYLPLIKQEISEETSIVFVTSHGTVRRNSLKDFLDIRANGKRAMNLEGGEELVAVRLARPLQHVLLSTKYGMSIRFTLEDLRVFQSRASTGVLGIRLKQGDQVVSMNILSQDDYTVEEKERYLKESALKRRSDGDALESLDQETLEETTGGEAGLGPLSSETFQAMEEREQMILSISTKGYGKRSSSYAFRRTKRGGRGVASMELNRKTGDLMGAFPVEKDGDVLLLTSTGNLLRCPVRDIRIAGRRTQGVILARLKAGEEIIAAVPLSNQASQEIELADDHEEDAI